MSRAQAESVIKNIIREIAQECSSKGQVVSETLVAFMVGIYLLLLNHLFPKPNIFLLLLLFKRNPGLRSK